MEHDDVIGRLRAMSDQPVDEATAMDHLALARATEHRSRRLGRVAVVAACAALLAVPAAAVAMGAGGDEPDDDVPADVASSLAEGEELSCTGPPPFAGDGAQSDAEREAAAAELEAWRAANCPADDAPEGDDDAPESEDDDVDEDGGRPSDVGPAVRGECTGPPPWAGTPAVPADPANGIVPSPRAAEAKAFAATRAACKGNDGAEEAEEAEVDDEGPPERTPGPPEGRTPGPPEGTPGGPPEGTPGGPPESTPDGAPEDVETDGSDGELEGDDGGPPEGTPGGPPEGAPTPEGATDSGTTG